MYERTEEAITIYLWMVAVVIALVAFWLGWEAHRFFG